jgi:hypothetical protein
LTLLAKTKDVLWKVWKKLRSVIADTQYSDEKLRSAADEAVSLSSESETRC